MRSHQYEQSTEDRTRIDRYLFRKFLDTAAAPVLVPVIYDHWLKDEAYLLFERKDGIPLKDTRLAWNDASADSSQNLVIIQATPQEQRSLAVQLYEAYTTGLEPVVFDERGTAQPICRNAAQRSYLLTVLRDYLKLIETI